MRFSYKTLAPHKLHQPSQHRHHSNDPLTTYTFLILLLFATTNLPMVRDPHTAAKKHQSLPAKPQLDIYFANVRAQTSRKRQPSQYYLYSLLPLLFPTISKWLVICNPVNMPPMMNTRCCILPTRPDLLDDLWRTSELMSRIQIGWRQRGSIKILLLAHRLTQVHIF